MATDWNDDPKALLWALCEKFNQAKLEHKGEALREIIVFCHEHGTAREEIEILLMRMGNLPELAELVAGSVYDSETEVRAMLDHFRQAHPDLIRFHQP